MTHEEANKKASTRAKPHEMFVEIALQSFILSSLKNMDMLYTYGISGFFSQVRKGRKKIPV